MKIRGFTLIEMLVALGVFAMVGLISARLVSSTIDNHTRVSERDGRLVEIQRAMQMIDRDVLQVSDRGVRDLLGDPVQPLLIGTDGTMEFTRYGWRNPLQHKRAELQRVGYTVQDGELHRLYWHVLDRAQDSLPSSQRLLGGVGNAEFFVLDASGNEHRFWPIAGFNPEDPSQRIVGLILRIEIEPFGLVERLWALPAL